MSTNLSVGIIGAGPGGLALGILLSRAGFHDFTIFEDGRNGLDHRVQQLLSRGQRAGGHAVAAERA
ncbi:MAG TPA: NAD(P)-binding protein [Mycobacterium sp.]